jgi:glutamine synthetase
MELHHFSFRIIEAPADCLIRIFSLRAGRPGTILMAGLDGIQNKIHPGDPMDKNLYDLPPEELADVPTVCGSLREALQSLEADHNFLLKGDVFNQDVIESYTALKWEEVYALEHTPHPIEYQMYYSS